MPSPEILRHILFGLLLLVCRPGFAAEVIPPKPDRYFNDYAGVVSKSAALRFNEQLAQFERETSNQFVVAIWSTMPSQSSIEDFTQRTFQAWKVWQAGKDNGVVLFVFVKEHKMRIHTGYGLEGALPDVVCDQIIRNEIAPHFRNNDYEGGIAVGIDSIFKAIRGEYKGTGQTNLEKRGNGNGNFSWILFLVVLVIFFIASHRTRKRGYRYSSSGGPYVSWWPSGGSGGGWSSGSSGGGFSGFSGGGGFSGGSGGGGASGSW